MIPVALRPRRTPAGAERAHLLRNAERVDVYDQDGLLSVAPDRCPVLRGPGPFALGHGSVARAGDNAHVCVVEGAGLLHAEEVSVAVWEGGAAAGSGAALVEVGAGGWACLRAAPGQPARAVVRTSSRGLDTPDEDVDSPVLLVAGPVAVRARSGQVRAGGGASVTASEVASVVHDPSVRLTVTDGRFVRSSRAPVDVDSDPLSALLDRLATRPPPAAPSASRLVLTPWLADDAPTTALVQPLLDHWEAHGTLRARSDWHRTAGERRVVLDGPVPPDLAQAWALPASVTHLTAGCGSVLAGDDVRIEGAPRADRPWWRRLRADS